MGAVQESSLSHTTFKRVTATRPPAGVSRSLLDPRAVPLQGHTGQCVACLRAAVSSRSARPESSCVALRPSVDRSYRCDEVWSLSRSPLTSGGFPSAATRCAAWSSTIIDSCELSSARSAVQTHANRRREVLPSSFSRPTEVVKANLRWATTSQSDRLATSPCERY